MNLVCLDMEGGLVPLLACKEELLPFYTLRGFIPTGEVWERRAVL